MNTADFTTVTEIPGTRVSKEALDMAWTRYALAAQRCGGKAVLEVACGPGPGLGHLAAVARTLVAGDYTAAHLTRARAHYGSRIPLVRLDALRLPFRPRTFDVVLLFEALYFLSDLDAFTKSCREVLTDEGLLLIATANPERPDFNAAPFSTRYLSASDLDRHLRAHGFCVDLFGGFPLASGTQGTLIRLAKQAAVRLNLIPKTMKGKELLKRLAFGPLTSFPPEMTPETGTYRAPTKLVDVRDAGGFKVIYVVARKEPR